MAELDAHLTELWAAIDDPSLRVGDRGWADRCCHEALTAIPPLAATIQDCVPALGSFAWVPCSIPREIGEHLQAVTEAVGRFGSAGDRTEARAHLAAASSSLLRADALMNQLMEIHLAHASFGLRGQPVSRTDREDALTLVRTIGALDRNVADLLAAAVDPSRDRSQSEWTNRINEALREARTVQASIPTTQSLSTLITCEHDPRINGDSECPTFAPLAAELEAVALDLADAANVDDQHEAARAIASATSRLITVTDQVVELILLAN